MFDSNILDVLIGVVFVFLMLSVATSWFVEFLAQIFKFRSTHLKNYLIGWLDREGADFVDALYQGPVIGAMFKPRKEGGLKKLLGIKEGPSFISAGDFVTAVFHEVIVHEEGEVEAKFDEFTAAVEKSSAIPSRLKLPLQTLMLEAAAKMETAEHKMVAARQAIEDWYDSVMDRAQGYYKRKVWAIGLICAFVLASLVNIDTIAISRVLWHNQDLRLAVAASAGEYAESVQALNIPVTEEGAPGEGDPGELAYAALQEVGGTLQVMDEANLPLFWKPGADFDPEIEELYRQNANFVFGSAEYTITKFLGITLTATAASFGAQIWFDLLKKLVNLRGTGPKPGEKKEIEIEKIE